MTSSPTPPDPSQGATDLDNGGNLPNPQAPSRVGVGLPSGAVEALRFAAGDKFSGGEIIEVVKTDIDEVLAWIDRYVPVPLQAAERDFVVDGVRVLTIDGDDPLLDAAELIRVNGRAFVPETPAIVEDEPMCWYQDEDGAPCGYPPAIGSGREARCERHAEILPGRCRICGCTRITACDVETQYGSRACGWTDETQTLCDAPDCLARAGGSPEWPLTPPVNHEAANREHAGVCDTIESRAARASFAEDHSVGPSRDGGSIKRSHRQEGRNFVD